MYLKKITLLTFETNLAAYSKNTSVKLLFFMHMLFENWVARCSTKAYLRRALNVWEPLTQAISFQCYTLRTKQTS